MSRLGKPHSGHDRRAAQTESSSKTLQLRHARSLRLRRCTPPIPGEAAPVSAERQLSTVISTNVTMPHMGHISKAIEAESCPSPRGPNSSKSVKPFDERNQKELAYTKLTDPGKPGRTETKSGGSPGNRPQARKNLKAKTEKDRTFRQPQPRPDTWDAYTAKSLTEQLPTHSEKRR